MIAVSLAYPDLDPDRIPARASWLQVHDAAGRYLGIFTRLDEVSAWAARRPGRVVRVSCRAGNRVVGRWVVAAAKYGGKVHWIAKTKPSWREGTGHDEQGA